MNPVDQPHGGGEDGKGGLDKDIDNKNGEAERREKEPKQRLSEREELLERREQAEEPAEEEATEEVEAPEGDEMAEGDDEALSDEGDDLLGDDPDAEEETTGPAVIYNGIADFRSFHRMVSGNEVELHWDVEHQGDRVVATQVTPMRTLRYEYLVHYDSLELSDIAVYQTGRGTAVMHMDINPALPDLRRPFSGRAESNYVIDVNGQGGYATGTIEAWWSEGGPKVKVTPSGPEWNTGSMMTSVVFRDGGSEVLVQKLGDDE